MTHQVAQQLLIRELIDRQGASSYVLTDQGRMVLETLMNASAPRTG